MLGQRYGIKFPFNVKSDDHTMLDMNRNESEQIKSEIMHILFTPTGQRLRQPTFGSSLIQYIFSPNDQQTWDAVQTNVRDTIKKYIPTCNLTNISVYETDGGMGLACRIQYTVNNSDGTASADEIMTKL